MKCSITYSLDAPIKQARDRCRRLGPITQQHLTKIHRTKRGTLIGYHPSLKRWLCYHTDSNHAILSGWIPYDGPTNHNQPTS